MEKREEPPIGTLVRHIPPEPLAAEQLPAEFHPLRLVLQPGGLALEMGQPDIVVGRHSTADVRLALPDVSRHHCRLQFRVGQWEIVDLDSLNGTFLNDQRLQAAVLEPGDVLRLGGLTFTVELPGLSLDREPSKRKTTSEGILRHIVNVLPRGAEITQEYRKAS